ncbi:hypothetical protein [Longitalea luteola]|uniref:hypothetical protein n=1 Tax=Longitalea luteola TaxID=2812563 RepID=UPI001A9765E2|nr:hypothetical protein [Longitalea luteola]
MKNIILSVYKRQSDSELITTGYRVTGKLKNNPNFPNPPAELEQAIKLLPEFQTSVSNAKGRDMEVINLKNEQKAVLITLLVALDKYVTATSNGDRGMLLSSGFPVAGDRYYQAEPVISQMEVELGPPGEATTRIKRLRGARAYMHQYTTEPPTTETVWVSEGSKFAFYTFSGLNSMAKYWFRVAAISQDGQMIYSPVITKVIQ